MTCQNKVRRHSASFFFFVTNGVEITFPEVMRQLAQEEHERVAKGEAPPCVDGFSPSAFIAEALELEELQYVYADQVFLHRD